MGGEFYNTLTDLARLGSAGVGIAVFMMVFILLMRGTPMDKSTARLREKFLTYGVGFAVFCGIVSFVSPFFQKEAKPGGPVKLRLAFSPDFGTESLTPPKVQLPDGSTSEPGKAFAIPPSDVTQVLTIGMDGPLKDVKNLRQTTAALAQSVATVQDQRNQLAASIVPTVGAPAAESLAEASEESKKLQENVVQSIAAGDFDKAAVLSQRLQSNVKLSAPRIRALVRAPGVGSQATSEEPNR